MKKILLVLAVAAFIVPSIAEAMEKKTVNLAIDCHSQHAYGSIVIPEGKKATRFQANYVTGQECGLKELAQAKDDPKTDVDEVKLLQKKWDERMPPPYGWGIKGVTGYFYRVFHQHLVKSLTTGNLGSLWLGPGKYSIELRGYMENSTLALSYWLEPYTPDGAKKPAAAAAPAAVGTVEKPHKPHPSSVAGKPHAPGVATPTAKQKIGPGIWGGVWYTHPGTITLKQSGNHVSGTYTLQSGKISGKIVGNTLVGRWSDAPSYKPPMDAGDAVYKMAPDGMSFSVDFRGGYGENKNFPWFRNAWKATRKP